MPIIPDSSGNLAHTSRSPHPRCRVIRILAIIVVSIALMFSFMNFYSTSYAPIRTEVFENADLLSIPSLYSDIENGIDITGWRVPPAIYFFPDILLYFLLRTLTGSMYTAIPLSGLMQFCSLVAGLVVLSKQVLSEGNKHLGFILTGIMTALFLTFFDHIHYAKLVFMMASHFGVMTCLPWGLVLIYQLAIKSEFNRKRVLLLLVLSLLTGFSDLFFVFQLVIPVCVCLVILVFARSVTFKRMAIIALVLVVGSALGYAGCVMLGRNNAVQGMYTGRIGMRESLENLLNVARYLVFVQPVHFYLVVSYTFACLLIVGQQVFAWMLSGKMPAPRPERLLHVLYFLTQTAVTIMVVALSGMFIDNHAFRYFQPLIFLPVFLGIPLIIELPKSLPERVYEIGAAIVGVLIIVISLGKIDLQAFVTNTTSDYYPSHVQCIDEHIAALGLRYGVAQYWWARPITELSKENLRVVQVHHDLNPFYWINNKYWYDIRPEFIVTDAKYPAMQEKHLSVTYLEGRLGSPDYTFTCDDGRYTILVYASDDSPLRSIFDGYFDE